VTQNFTTYRFKSALDMAAALTDTRAPRTLPDRLSEFTLNIKDFGAVGNGSTDDTDAINATIDWAYNNTLNRTKGAIILIPPGIFIIGKGGTVQLKLDRDTALFGGVAALSYLGCGHGASILRGTRGTGQKTQGGGAPITSIVSGTGSKVRVFMAPSSVALLKVGYTVRFTNVTGVTTTPDINTGNSAGNNTGLFGHWDISALDANAGWIELANSTFNSGAFTGGDPMTTIVDGGFPNNDFLVAANFQGGQVLSMKDLAIENLSTQQYSGAFMAQAGQIRLRSCRFKGTIGYTNQLLGFGGSVMNCVFECSKPITSASVAATSRLPNVGVRSPTFNFSKFGPYQSDILNGSIGMAVGQGFYCGNRATGFDIGFALTGPPGSLMTVIGNKAIQCGVGFAPFICGNSEGAGNVGGAGQGDPWPPGLNFHAIMTLTSNWCDRCGWGAYDLGSSGGVVWTANAFTGDTGPCDPAVIDNITWSSGTATVTTHDDHNLATSGIVGDNITNITAGNGNVVRVWLTNDYTGVLSGGERVRIQGVTGTIASYVNAGDDGTGLWSVAAFRFLPNGTRWIELRNSTFSGSYSRSGTVDLTTQLVIDASPARLTPDGTGHQIVACTRTGARTFTYRLASFPGFTSATWNYPIEYCCVTHTVNTSAMLANHLDALVARASILFGYGQGNMPGRNLIAAMTPRGDIVFSDQYIGNFTSGISKYIGCGTPAKPPPNAFLLGDLPPGPETQFTAMFPPREGDEYNVTDAPSASFRDVITAGGGRNHYKVRYDGKNWRRVG
jgi:Pectate lyase superfamily protein